MDGWEEVEGRRKSKMLMVNRIRSAVDAWRDASYPCTSATSKRLLRFWFEETHHIPDIGMFRYYFCQREAVETIIYLYEVHRFSDCFKLLQEFHEGTDGTQLDLEVTNKGRRIIRRNIPSEIAKEAEQDLPRENLTRLAVKMATGSGKTVVMALVIAWSYLHRRFEPGSELADNFLVLAPNVIVFERLRQDFEGGRIFYTLPILPPEWRDEWHVEAILRGNSKIPKSSGNLFVTNIQQVYERDSDDDEPINPAAALRGREPPANLHAPVSMLDRIKRMRNVMVLNDEAHHLHDDTLRWNETLLELDDHLTIQSGRGLVAWLDFSATPKNQNGTFFPWIIVDYPLAQAVEDHIVKTPLIIHQTDKKDPDKYAHEDAGDVYNEWIATAVARWREHVRDYGALGEYPILFVMAETTKDADSIAERLEREDELKDHVLTIHVKERGKSKGEIHKKDLQKAREAARDIDSGTSHYRAVVSVLMLREGWDVRNVSVILGLRPFSAKASILPEQAIGRGLRLMRKIPMGNTQILEIIGTKAFEDFVRGLETEGLGVGMVKIPPKPGKRVHPQDDRKAFDIEIPRTTALFAREYKNLDHFDPLALAPLGQDEAMPAELRQRIQMVHGTVNVPVHSGEVAFDDHNVPVIENLLSSLTNRIMKRARITGVFPVLYPTVRAYVREKCFGRKVELDEVAVRRALADSALVDSIAGLFSRKIGELTTEKRTVKIAGDPYRLSETAEFSWRRHFVESQKTIYNIVACYNSFEADFARFLDNANDVDRFAKLCEWFTGFHVQYLKSTGALGTYYPDFVVVQKDTSRVVNWIAETKGKEDVEVAAKDKQMGRWCEEVTEETGVPWGYLKVPYRAFYPPKRFASFAALVAGLATTSAELVYPPPGIKVQ